MHFEVACSFVSSAKRSCPLLGPYVIVYLLCSKCPVCQKACLYGKHGNPVIAAVQVTAQEHLQGSHGCACVNMQSCCLCACALLSWVAALYICCSARLTDSDLKQVSKMPPLATSMRAAHADSQLNGHTLQCMHMLSKCADALGMHYRTEIRSE